MAFDGKEGAQITLQTGADMTEEYRQQNPGERKAHFYGKDILLDLLNQQDCQGIRMYYGIDNNGDKELVLVGANSDESDMTNLVVDVSTPCPNRCDTASPLNS